MADPKNPYQDISERYYNPEYAAWYREQMMKRYGEEIPAAQAITAGAMSGETSQALAQQRMAMGQLGAQQAAAGVGGPLAARQAAYGAAQQAGKTTAQAAGQRQAEIMGAREGELAAQMRQLGYSAGLTQLDLERRRMMEQARQGQVQREFAEKMRQEEQNRKIFQGVLQAGSGVAGKFAPGAKQFLQAGSTAFGTGENLYPQQGQGG